MAWRAFVGSSGLGSTQFGSIHDWVWLMYIWAEFCMILCFNFYLFSKMFCVRVLCMCVVSVCIALYSLCP
jgi:hypothetical protein